MSIEYLTRDGLYPLGSWYHPQSHDTWAKERALRARWTGEKRPPKAGEWYFSGAVICAYRAVADLSQEYHIAEIVRTETVSITKVLGPALVLLALLPGCTGLPQPAAIDIGLTIGALFLLGIMIFIRWGNWQSVQSREHRRIRIARGWSGLMLLLLLVGCSLPPDLVPPPGRGQSAAYLDKVTCEYEAERAVPSTTYTGMRTMVGDVFAIALAQERIERLCKLSRGWLETRR